MSEHVAEHQPAHGHGGPVVDEHFGEATDGKVGMWIFLLTDAFSFSGLLLAYAILRAGSEHWPIYKDDACNIGAANHAHCDVRLGIPFTAVMTFVLICSSVTMVLSLAAAQNRDRKGLLTWLGATIAGGTFFLCGQAYEYSHLIHEGFTIQKDHMMATFFTVTGFHGMHVFTGVTYLTIIWIQAALFGKYTHGDYNNVEIAGLFWHFVDLVWILVFTFVYLI
jgi:heme/copper-type cytochrome/quinol oxidase subunit 3